MAKSSARTRRLSHATAPATFEQWKLQFLPPRLPVSSANHEQGKPDTIQIARSIASRSMGRVLEKL